MTDKGATMDAEHSSRFAGVRWGRVAVVSNPREHAAPRGKGKAND